VDLARSFPPESPGRVPHLDRTVHSVGQKVFARHPKPVNGRKRFQLGTIVFAHDCTASESYVQHGKILYDIRFQADKVLITRVPQSAIRNSHQSIFWRLLRPEFVKHRGRSLTEKYFPVSEVSSPSRGAVADEKVSVKNSNPLVDDTESYQYRSSDGDEDARSSAAHGMEAAHTQQWLASPLRISLQLSQVIDDNQNPLKADLRCVPPNAPSAGSCPLSFNPSSAVHSTASARALEAPCEASAYSAAEALLEYQAASISTSASSQVLSASKIVSADANYTTADGICAGTDSGMSTDGMRKDGATSYSDGSVSSRSFTGDEYYHHYSNMNRNKTYFNYDNYLQYQIDNCCSTDPDNLTERNGGDCDDNSSRPRGESKSAMYAHDDSCTYGHADGMLSYQSDFSILNQNPDDFLHSATALHSAVPERGASVRKIEGHPCYHPSAPQTAAVDAKVDLRNYIPSYSGGELLFDYQSTAPSYASAVSASHVNKQLDPALKGIAVNPPKSNRNSGRRNRVRSRSEDLSRTHHHESPCMSLINASVAVESLRICPDETYNEGRCVTNNRVEDINSGDSSNVVSKPVSESRRVKSRSGSLGAAPGSLSECPVGTCGAREKHLIEPQTLIPDHNRAEGEKSGGKISTVPIYKPVHAAVRGSPGLPAAAATDPKDPPPLSADSLSAFSGDTDCNVGSM
jgi:hypothetical protein